jgi:outer membrane lipoprotein SlyB
MLRSQFNKENFMKFRLKSAALMLAVCATLSVSVAQAQQNQAPRIDGFSVDEVRRLDPGVELNFLMYGTPGGRAVLRIAGSQRDILLTETSPGQYEGYYTISRNDRLNARSEVRVNLRVGNMVVTDKLVESLQIGVGRHDTAKAPGPMPRIENFSVQPASDLNGGSELVFNVNGTPGAKVDVMITGARAKFFLQENRPGQYSGEYLIRRSDRIAPNSGVTATMLLGSRVTTAKLNGQLMSSAMPAPRAADLPPRVCYNCGTIEAINVVEVKGEGGYLGTIGGGVVGALLGSQVGGGNGRTAAEIAGAVGGAYAGRAIEARSKSDPVYEVVVRLQSGATQTVSFNSRPEYRVGERVTVSNGALARMQ